MIAMRLFRIIASWGWDGASRDHNDLTVTRHAQTEPLGGRGEFGSSGGVADVPLQLSSLGAQVLPLPFELLHHTRLRDSERAPPNDARGYEDETKKCEGDHGPTPSPGHAPAATFRTYGALRHALSLALRERGLRSDSSGDAVMGFRVIDAPSAWPRQVHWGWRGGQIQDALQSRNAFFTTRSSPE